VGILKNSSKGKKKTKLSVKIRLGMFLILFILFISILGYNCILNLVKLKELKDEKVRLEEQIVYLADEKENLEADVERLSDSTYIARYAREKYLYSKSDEIILRISDDE
jgi:cell division protein DivIC